MGYRSDSLRSIEISLRAQEEKLYHCGIKGKVSRSTLSDANDNRDYRIFQDFGFLLIKEAKKLYKKDFLYPVIKGSVYAFDATVISLCLKLFPWAKFRDSKAGIKAHTLYDVERSLPIFITISSANKADNSYMKTFRYEAGAFYIFDRGYWDISSLFYICNQKAFFVIRSKSNILFKVAYSLDPDIENGIIIDRICTFKTKDSKHKYSDQVRVIKFYDKEANKKLTFVTNNFALPAKTIAELYRSRWQVELFFKWIKQHLRVKSFLGHSENSIQIQIWVAMISYLLVAIVRKKLAVNRSMFHILEILSLNLFEKTPMFELLSHKKSTDLTGCYDNQLNLF